MNINKEQILIRPIVTEKSNYISEKSLKYTFQVLKKSNKIEIKKAIESFYNVKIKDINTILVPGKKRSKYSKGSGFLHGIKSGYKKAVVTLEKDQTIDLYADI